MAWLLAGVFESGNFQQLERSPAGGGSGLVDKAEREEGRERGKEEVGVGGGPKGEKASSADNVNTESHVRASAGIALADSLATRKRAASLLYQLLITVSTRML